MRLLLAEDEEDLAEALGVFFEKNHFSVDIVHDGRVACEYAENDRSQHRNPKLCDHSKILHHFFFKLHFSSSYSIFAFSDT